MLIILPLLPIVAAVALVAVGVFSGMQINLALINTILITSIVLAFGGISVFNLTRNYVSVTKKVICTTLCVVLGVVSGFVLNYFVRRLTSIDMGEFGIVDFAFTAVVGSCLSFLIILGCVMVCAWLAE